VRKILSTAGVPERTAGFLRWCLQLLRRAIAQEAAVEVPGHDLSDLQEAFLGSVERFAALARAERALLREARRTVRQ
jgi:hypothetical protein